MMQDSEFVSLTSVLEPWFEKDRSELPGDLDEAWRDSRQAGGVKFLLSLWDGLSPTRRRTMAAQFDYSYDPANRDAAKAAFEIEREIEKWEAVATPTARDLGKQEKVLKKLRRAAAAIDARLSKPATDARAAAGEADGSPVEPTPTEAASPERTVVASPDAAPVGAGGQTDKRPQPTDTAVRQWFRDRVARWPDNKAAPSEGEDQQAIAAYFAPGLTRDEIRLVREEVTPEAWRKQGRRRPWGIEKRKLSPP
jgi:hypothetical protein